MQIRRLELEEFRCFRHLQLDWAPTGLRLVGSNGAGKTSLVEALYLLATTKSFRVASERNLINLTSGRELGLP
ncbi:MAG: AAA family ATPase, partial [Thermomicrobium sp.]|nr:AAA family ATPase [Thermomicrobium sp.]